MALKDWKQKPNRHGLWAYKKSNGEFIFIDKNIFTGEWYLYKDNSAISNSFKTKSQALKHARAYMRKN